jgi:hypothetical protein
MGKGMSIKDAPEANTDSFPLRRVGRSVALSIQHQGISDAGTNRRTFFHRVSPCR